MALIGIQKRVAAAGTAEAIQTSPPLTGTLVITALDDNTGDIVVGGSDVVAAIADRNGPVLAPGASITYIQGDRSSWSTVLTTADVFIDAENNDDGVSCQVWT